MKVWRAVMVAGLLSAGVGIVMKQRREASRKAKVLKVAKTVGRTAIKFSNIGRKALAVGASTVQDWYKH